MHDSQLSDYDWSSLRPTENFPKLRRDDCRKTAGEDQSYNSVSWFLQHDAGWVNPPANESARDNMLNWAQLEVCSKEDPERKARLYTRDGDYLHFDCWNSKYHQWESKLGGCLRMVHPEDGLADGHGEIRQKSIYGNPTLYYKRRVNSGPTVNEPAVEQPSTDKTQAVTSSLEHAFPQLANAFDKVFEAWKATWFAGDMAVRENSSDRAQGPAWDAVLAFAQRKNVLPQLVDKLKDPSNAFAVELYNKVQWDESKKVNPTDVGNYYFLRKQAEMIRKLYTTLIDDFQNLNAEWQAHQEAVWFSSNSHDYLNHPSYHNLVAMGEQIVPLIMREYSNEQGDWWHEMLYEIRYKQPSGTMTFFKASLYRQWAADYNDV